MSLIMELSSSAKLANLGTLDIMAAFTGRGPKKAKKNCLACYFLIFVFQRTSSLLKFFKEGNFN